MVLVGAAVGLYFLYAPTEVERILNRGEWVHLLLVGLDSGGDGGPYADAVTLIGLGPDGSYCLLSFPPNLLVRLGGEWRSLSSLWSQGIGALVGAIQGLVGREIHYYAVVDYDDFRWFVDAIGGIELEVDHHLVYVDQSQGLFIDIPAGKQHLDGERALQFVRYREKGDEYGRLARQQQFLTAVVEKVRAMGFKAWRELLEFGLNRVETNLSLWDGLYLWRRYRDVPVDRSRLHAAPAVDEGGSLYPDLVRLRQLVAGCEEGRTFYTRDQVGLIVLNGAGVRFLAHKTRLWLVERGFKVLRIGDADRFDYPATLIADLSGDPRKVEMLRKVLPVPTEEVDPGELDLRALGPIPEGADLLLILGRGFRVGS